MSGDEGWAKSRPTVRQGTPLDPDQIKKAGPVMVSASEEFMAELNSAVNWERLENLTEKELASVKVLCEEPEPVAVMKLEVMDNNQVNVWLDRERTTGEVAEILRELAAGFDESPRRIV